MRHDAEPDGRELPGLLIAVANPDTVPGLIDIAAALHAVVGYRLVATHVITVPPQANLDSARGSPQLAEARELLTRAIRAGAAQGLTIRGVVEIAREVHDGIAQAAESHRLDLLLVGFSSVTDEAPGAERAFDRVMHRVARSTNADLIVAKLRNGPGLRVLVPVAGDTNLRVTALLVRALADRPDATITFLHAIGPEADEAEARAHIGQVLTAYSIAVLGPLEVVVSEDPFDATVERLAHHDMAIIGANPRPSLAESVFGSWIDRLAGEADRPVLVVRAKQRV